MTAPAEQTDQRTARGWRDDALCRDHDPEVFFPTRGGSSLPAKQICNQCPVRPQCLNYAVQTNAQHGIWGGRSQQELRLLARSSRRTTPAPQPATNTDDDCGP